MNFALGYSIERFFYRIFEFLRHWYVVGSYRYAGFVMGMLRRMDRTIAWRITFVYLFKPLYGDYSFLGRVVGFLFRVLRLIVGGAIYLVIFALALLVYLLWLFIPIYLVMRIFS